MVKALSPLETCPRAKVAASHSARRPAGWLGDFAFSDGQVEIRKTAIQLKVDRRLISEVLNWIGYLAILGVVAAFARLRREPAVAIRFAPDQPRPWYLLRGAALWSGIRMTASAKDAAATFYFDDVTQGAAPAQAAEHLFNFGCTDVSKSHVAAVFESVFGYPLRVDPTLSTGEIVEKSERNGVHDGSVVQAPLTPRPGHVYQRLVDTTDDDGFSYDLRTPCVGGAPVLVWIKQKSAGGRFAIHNRRVSLHDPAEIFSADEIATLRRFNARMGLDWGGLDILRDRHNGRIYVVDVNKTDVGPIIALSWNDKIRSMNRLSRALKGLLAPQIAQAAASRALALGS